MTTSPSKSENSLRGEGLSPSSMTLYNSCQRRYFHYKVGKTPNDADYQDDVESLQVGKAFHRCLEVTRHSLAGFGIRQIELIVKEFELDSSFHTPLLFAMLAKYKRVHDLSGLQAIAVEVPISTTLFYGVVDVVLMDPFKSEWWIGDIKTASSFNPAIIPSLFSHPQLNLYAAHASTLATSLDLDMEKFKGCRYLLTTKSKLVRKKGEDLIAFSNRLGKAIKSVDFSLPIHTMRAQKAASEHFLSFQAIKDAEGRIEEFKPNFGNCMSYYRPCPYWSNCHGSLYSDMFRIDSISSD